MNELRLNNSRARSSAANDETVVAGIQVEGELPGFPDVDDTTGLVLQLTNMARIDADTTMRGLTEEEFLRGKQRLRHAARQPEETARPEPRTSWLDLLVLR